MIWKILFVLVLVAAIVLTHRTRKQPPRVLLEEERKDLYRRAIDSEQGLRSETFTRREARGIEAKRSMIETFRRIEREKKDGPPPVFELTHPKVRRIGSKRR